MSVWQDPIPASLPLAGTEGVLVCVTIDVEARDLESLLEALASVEFPINPQIYHDGAVRYHYPDGREQERPVTLVEFPAYERRIEEVRRALRAYEFDAARMHVSAMLDSIHTETLQEHAPEGAPYDSRSIVRRRFAAA